MPAAPTQIQEWAGASCPELLALHAPASDERGPYVRPLLSRMKQPHKPDIGLRLAGVPGEPDNVGHLAQDQPPQNDCSVLPLDASYIGEARDQGYRFVEPSPQPFKIGAVSVLGQPGELPAQIGAEINVNTNTMAHARVLPPAARGRPAECLIEIGSELLFRDLGDIASLDLLPGRPGLRALPLFSAA